MRWKFAAYERVGWNEVQVQIQIQVRTFRVTAWSKFSRTVVTACFRAFALTVNAAEAYRVVWWPRLLRRMT